MKTDLIIDFLDSVYFYTDDETKTKLSRYKLLKALFTKDYSNYTKKEMEIYGHYDCNLSNPLLISDLSILRMELLETSFKISNLTFNSSLIKESSIFDFEDYEQEYDFNQEIISSILDEHLLSYAYGRHAHVKGIYLKKQKNE